MMKRYALDAVVVVIVFCLCLLSLEAFHTWQRVNAMWNWVNAEQARITQAQPQK